MRQGDNIFLAYVLFFYLLKIINNKINLNQNEFCCK